jgi:hypothetical protein
VQRPDRNDPAAAAVEPAVDLVVVAAELAVAYLVTEYSALAVPTGLQVSLDRKPVRWV